MPGSLRVRGEAAVQGQEVPGRAELLLEGLSPWGLPGEAQAAALLPWVLELNVRGEKSST